MITRELRLVGQIGRQISRGKGEEAAPIEVSLDDDIVRELLSANKTPFVCAFPPSKFSSSRF